MYALHSAARARLVAFRAGSIVERDRHGRMYDVLWAWMVRMIVRPELRRTCARTGPCAAFLVGVHAPVNRCQTQRRLSACMQTATHWEVPISFMKTFKPDALESLEIVMWRAPNGWRQGTLRVGRNPLRGVNSASFKIDEVTEFQKRVTWAPTP